MSEAKSMAAMVSRSVSAPHVRWHQRSQWWATMTITLVAPEHGISLAMNSAQRIGRPIRNQILHATGSTTTASPLGSIVVATWTPSSDVLAAWRALFTLRQPRDCGIAFMEGAHSEPEVDALVLPELHEFSGRHLVRQQECFLEVHGFLMMGLHGFGKVV